MPAEVDEGGAFIGELERDPGAPRAGSRHLGVLGATSWRQRLRQRAVHERDPGGGC